MSKLKLTKDGTKILWPQPTDSPLDPQNWSEREKTLHLIILILVSIVPDFDSGLGKVIHNVPFPRLTVDDYIGIASLFPLAKEFDTNVNVINNVTSK